MLLPCQPASQPAQVALRVKVSTDWHGERGGRRKDPRTVLSLGGKKEEKKGVGVLEVTYVVSHALYVGVLVTKRFHIIC